MTDVFQRAESGSFEFLSEDVVLTPVDTPDFIASLKIAIPGVRFEDLWEIVPKEAA